MHLKFAAVAPVMSLLLSAMLILSACGGDAAETSPPDQTSETTPVAEVAASPEAASPTEEPETATQATSATETTESEADDVEDEAAADEEEVSVTDPLTPVECESIEIPDDERIPAISDDDWVKGPESASLTLIEYGDFQ